MIVQDSEDEFDVPFDLNKPYFEAPQIHHNQKSQEEEEINKAILNQEGNEEINNNNNQDGKGKDRKEDEVNPLMDLNRAYNEEVKSDFSVDLAYNEEAKCVKDDLGFALDLNKDYYEVGKHYKKKRMQRLMFIWKEYFPN